MSSIKDLLTAGKDQELYVAVVDQVTTWADLTAVVKEFVPTASISMAAIAAMGLDQSKWAPSVSRVACMATGTAAANVDITFQVVAGSTPFTWNPLPNLLPSLVVSDPVLTLSIDATGSHWTIQDTVTWSGVSFEFLWASIGTLQLSQSDSLAVSEATTDAATFLKSAIPDTKSHTISLPAGTTLRLASVQVDLSASPPTWTLAATLVEDWDLGKDIGLAANKLVLQSTALSVSFAGASLDTVSLGAQMLVGGVGLAVQGTYDAGGNWKMDAAMNASDSVLVSDALGALIGAPSDLPAFLKNISVSRLAVSVDHGAGTWSATGYLTIKLSDGTALLAGLSILENSLGHTWSVDLSLSGQSKGCMAEVCSLLGSYGMPDLSSGAFPLDLELSTLGICSFTGTDVTVGSTWSGRGSGSLLIESDGTSIDIDIEFDETTAGGKSSENFQITIAGLSFQGSSAAGISVFSFTGPDTVQLSDLARLLRITALQGSDFDLALTVDAAFLVAQAATAGAAGKKLFGLQLSIAANLGSNPILDLIIGSGGVGLNDASILAASAPWSAADLAKITGLPALFKMPTQVPQGPGFAGTLSIGSTSVLAQLSPSGQQPPDAAPSAAPPAPAAVTSSSAARWFDVHKQVGPVYLDRAGFALGSSDGERKVDLLCDASFMLGPITVSLIDFSLEFPLKWGFSPSDVGISLSGMDLAYDQQPVTISGGFLHTHDASGNDLYLGEALIQSETLHLSAIGEYATNPTSLALFAVLNEPPLGGPVFCYVTGLALGFGYNSKLKIPTTAAAVAQFPLITAATSAAPADAMTVFAACATPSSGDEWLAIGILFTSFEIVQSVALLVVSFGHDLQFALLGQSELSMPPDTAEPLAYAQMDIEATYSPNSGALQVVGVLAPSSYVLSKDCHITGGFAYMLKESGDVLETFGGYHPHFDYAAHGYPAVPRLQMLWNVDEHTCIKGSLYFAMTPAVMMAGCSMQATWSCGIFSAWFDLDVDLLMQWKPFHYEADFAMSLGVSFELHIWFVHVHFTFHVGASLHAQGPPFSGTAHIDLDVISFDVSFGPSPTPPAPLLWPAFRAMLPGDATVDGTRSDLLSAKITDGLVKDLSQDKNRQPADLDWVLNGTHFSLDLRCAVPNAEGFGILPMAKTGVHAPLLVTLSSPSGGTITLGSDANSSVVLEAITGNMAAAHWATTPPGLNDGALSLTCGFRLYGGRPNPDRTSPVLVSTLLTEANAVSCISDRPAPLHPFA